MDCSHSSPWGKFVESLGMRHHLAHHCADVAACFEVLLTLPVVRSRVRMAGQTTLSPRFLARLSLIAFLHDIGKLHPGFQAKGWPAHCRRHPLHGHGAEGLAILVRHAPWRVWAALGLSGLGWWGDYGEFVQAALAHHGRPLAAGPMTEQWEPAHTPDFAYDPEAGAQILGTAARAWFAEAFTEGEEEPLPEPALAHLFAGLVSLADWLGSDRRFFPHESVFRESYIATARENAARAVAAVRLDLEALRPRALGRAEFTHLTGFARPAPHQRAVAEMPLDQRLILLEAETGAGKTEAAFWRFARLFEAGAVDGLYFALPTRSAARQLYQRVDRMLVRFVGEHSLRALLAVPGYFKVGEASGEALPDWRVRWDDEGTAAEDQLAARWAAESTKRYLAAPVAVGTIDQAMLAALQVKHSSLRAACLVRSLLVIDEIHASDRYMSEIQARLLENHLACGGHALLMSATLGSSARTRWLAGRRGTPPSFEAAVAAPYPAVWSSQARQPLAVGGSGREKTVSLSLAADMKAQTVAGQALAAARAGARVLVIRNTVTAAVAAWQAIVAAGGEALLLQVAGGPALHHSRFAPEDRERLDDAVERALAHDAARVPGGLIVVGSQTLEQSLDLDADFLITDLCPIDVLLQRLGRLQRHDLPRPSGFEGPACLVLVPEDDLAPLLAPRFDNGLGAIPAADGGWDGIYLDLALLELTRRLVCDRPQWRLPADNRFLVESAIHEERIAALLAELGPAWRDYHTKVVGQKSAQAQAARGLLRNLNQPFGEERFPSGEEAVRTRLGAEGVRLSFAQPVIGPFGHEITALTLPAHWSYGIDPTTPVVVAPLGQGLRVGVGERWFSYDRRGLQKPPREGAQADG